MTSKRSARPRVFVLAALLASIGGGASACPVPDSAAVSSAVQGMFSAMASGDLKAASSYLTPDFYIYDGGMRFDGDGILHVIQEQEKAGSVYAWTVTEPKVRFACETAWITYVNRGGFTKAGLQTPLTWLESGVLQYRKGRWLIAFMHSTPTPAATKP